MDENFNDQNNNQQSDYTNQYNQYNQQQPQTDYSNQYNQYNQQPQQQNYYNQNNQYGQHNNQPQQYNDPYYNQQYPQYVEPQDNNSKGFAVASLVLGILSVSCCCGGFITSILGLIFGIISRKRKAEGNGLATAGIILSIIGIVLGILAWVYVIITGQLSAYYYYHY